MPSPGKYEEPLPCGGKLTVDASSWRIRYYFPGPNARHNGTFFTVEGSTVAQFIEVLLEDWEELELLKSKVPAGGEFSRICKMTTSIRIGAFAPGVCLHHHHAPINSKQRLLEVISGYKYAMTRAPRIQALLATL